MKGGGDAAAVRCLALSRVSPRLLISSSPPTQASPSIPSSPPPPPHRIEIEGGSEIPILDGSALGWTLDVQV